MTAHTLISPEPRDRVRRACAAGSTAQDLIAACGVSRAQVCARARGEGWRRADLPAEALPKTDPFDPEAPPADPADPAAMAEQAWRRCAHALRCGRAGEARAWLRLHRDLRAVAQEAEAATQAREHEQSQAGAAAQPEARLHVGAPSRPAAAGADASPRGAHVETAPSAPSATPRPDQTHKTHTFARSGAPARPRTRARRRARGRGGGSAPRRQPEAGSSRSGRVDLPSPGPAQRLSHGRLGR